MKNVLGKKKKRQIKVDNQRWRFVSCRSEIFAGNGEQIKGKKIKKNVFILEKWNKSVLPNNLL